MTYESVGTFVVLIAFAWAATPRVWWGRGLFGLESKKSYRWPGDPPADLKPGFEPEVFGTRFLCIVFSLILVVFAQQLWSANTWWVYATALLVAIARSWVSALEIREDGGLERDRNGMELMLLWVPLAALIVYDLVVVASSLLWIAQLLGLVA